MSECVLSVGTLFKYICVVCCVLCVVCCVVLCFVSLFCSTMEEPSSAWQGRTVWASAGKGE